MEKIICFFALLCIVGHAQDVNIEDKQQLQKECLQCHVEQQIPSALIYRRYLMKYSTFERMEKAIFTYIKNPDKKRSIMPSQFFLKFPMKEKTMLDDDTLQKTIKSYLNTFDVKKKLVLPQ
ncbi:MAG: hypothetical protein B6D54_01580 [Epsilonproteobacteria bacterium 4484_65]|nr:MAG: hypothetical protein B6D54_01580 [Epsilonproteobacteria bacterium 4484_65]HEC45333.1 hypothetical protein [Campylobacterota bacterium]